jgi:hypothetical protein
MDTVQPEKDERVHDPDDMVKGIFMADTVAALENETVKTLCMVQVETLELKT